MLRVPVRFFVSRSTPVLALALLASLVSTQDANVTATPFAAIIVAVATNEASGALFDVANAPNGVLTAAAPLDGMEERPKLAARDGM